MPRRLSILCVDDEEAALAVRRKVLEEAGYLVFTAATVTDAVAFFKSHQPVDLVITDHLLPGATGQDLTRALRRVNPKLPVLTLSGGQIPSSSVQPPDFYLHKLDGPTELIAKVQSILLAREQ